MNDDKYSNSHPNYEELEVPEYTQHNLRLVTEHMDFAQASLEWVSDREVGRYMGEDFSRVSLDGEKSRIEEIIENEDAYNWVILCDGKAIGNIHIGDIKDTSQEFGVRAGHLAYIIGAKHLWSKGIATTIVRKVLEWSFTKGAFGVIKARVLPQNKRSLAVLKKFGFGQYGIEDYDGPDIGEPTWYVAYKLTKASWRLTRSVLQRPADDVASTLPVSTTPDPA